MLTLQDIRSILLRAAYPASKQELIDYIRRDGYPHEVAERLEVLPEHEYGSVDTVIDTMRMMKREP